MLISTANLYADQITLALTGLGSQAEKTVVDVLSLQSEVVCGIGIRFTYGDPKPQRPIENFNDVLMFDTFSYVDITGSPAADAVRFKAEADYRYTQWVAKHA